MFLSLDGVVDHHEYVELVLEPLGIVERVEPIGKDFKFPSGLSLRKNSSTRRTLCRVADRFLHGYLVPVYQTCSANRKDRCKQIAQLLVKIINMSHREKEIELLGKATSSTYTESIEAWLD